MSGMPASATSTLDPISFLFGQVQSQVDYLFESGYLSLDRYSTIAGALLQSSPPSTPSHPFALGSTSAFTNEPGAYASSPIPSALGPPPPPVQSGSVSSGQQHDSQIPHKSSRPSLLKFTSKSNKGKERSNEAALPHVPFAEAEEPQLGRINRSIRGMLEGGFVLGQIVDQALALTPGVPESLRESIVERVEEGSRDYVRKATDPRNQALWKEHAQRAGSSAWKVARGGGGTSRASQSGRSDPSSGSTNVETGEYSLLRSDAGPGSNGSVTSSTSSIHSYFASPTINVTTVVTVTTFKEEPIQSDFAVNQPSPLEQSAPWLGPSTSSTSQNPPTGQMGISSPSAHDPNFVSGRDW